MSLLLLGTATVLAVGYFSSPSATDQAVKVGTIVKPELIFALFTSAIGFITGLFVPSPVSKGKTGQSQIQSLEGEGPRLSDLAGRRCFHIRQTR
jgi:hypothetical protein